MRYREINKNRLSTFLCVRIDYSDSRGLIDYERSRGSLSTMRGRACADLAREHKKNPGPLVAPGLFFGRRRSCLAEDPRWPSPPRRRRHDSGQNVTDSNLFRVLMGPHGVFWVGVVCLYSPEQNALRGP